jgi:uncharacterized membrane protein
MTHMSPLLERFERLVVRVVPMVVLGVVGSAAAVFGGLTDTFLAFYAVTWALTLAFVAFVDRARAEPPDTTDPLFVLQQRYARGDIDDAAFERTLDRLLVGDDLERSRRDVEREFLVE